MKPLMEEGVKELQKNVKVDVAVAVHEIRILWSNSVILSLRALSY